MDHVSATSAMAGLQLGKPPITIGLVQIAQVNWAHRKREQYAMVDGVITPKTRQRSAPAPSFVYIPYAVGSLQAYAHRNASQPERLRWLPHVYKNMPIGDIVGALDAADIVGFSSYVWNVRQNLEIARRLKMRRPECVIVFGGPEVPANAETFLRQNRFIDIACHGEAEIVFLDVIERFDSRVWDGIGSTSHIARDGRFVTTKGVGRTKDLTRFPSPYLEGVFDPLLKAHPDQGWMAMWETNRGCPYSCTYCDWGSAVASKVHRFEIERLKAEIDWFAANDIRFLFICDANFGILPRDIDITRYLVESYDRHGGFVNVSIQNAKNQVERTYQIQKILSESKVATFGATIAMQGVAEQTLKAIKRDNISLGAFNELQRRFKRDGLDTYTDVIVGLPGETYESFADGLDLIISNGQHNRMTSYNCSVLINAEMGDPAYQARYGIESVPLQIVYQHDSLEIAEREDVHEYINTIVATNTLDRHDWRRVRVYAWMAELLHFNRLLQMVFVLMVERYGFSYRRLIEAFVAADRTAYPTVAGLVDVFATQAANIQAGQPEFIPSRAYLGIWWPADQFALIDMVAQKRLPAFYAEARCLLQSLLTALDRDANPSPIDDAIRLNQAMFRLPETFEDIEIEVDYNIDAFYRGALEGVAIPLKRAPHRYRIERGHTVWLSLGSWATDVVLQVYQRSQYLYPIQRVEPVAAGVALTIA